MERRSSRDGKGFQRGRKHSSSSSSSSSSRPLRSNNLHPKHNKYDDKDDKRTAEVPENSSSTVSSIVGTCLDMCPVRERAQRERLRDLSVFERLNGNPGRTSPSLAVKKFCRTISTTNMQPSDVRPLQVLQDTLTYLFSLLDALEHPFDLVHDFIFDRTRAIRQDLSMQNIINDQVIHMYEKIVKFHIISHYKLPRCSGNPNISSVHYLNMEQLSKSLMSLYDLYDGSRRFSSVNKNEAEFCSFYILLHLGSKSQSTVASLSLWFRHLATPIIKSKEMCFARRLLRFFRIGNYKCFFSAMAAEASYLQYCLIDPFINEVRLQAISCINYGGYKVHPYPLAHLSKLLMMKESDLESFCNACGLETTADEAGNKLLPMKQTGLCQPKGGFQSYSFLGLERFQRFTCEMGLGPRTVVSFRSFLTGKLQ